MTDTLRWGILGNAKIARDHLAPAIHASQRGALTAVASLSGRPMDGFGPLTLHTSYEAMLADPDVDAIYIPLPNNMHVEWTRRALQAGKHVLCEKPISWTAAEIEPLIAARDASGKIAAEAFMVCFHPQWQHVRKLIADGAIGELRHVQGAFTFNNTDLDNIRNRPEMQGGALGDIGVYPSVTTRFATGQEPLRATSRTTLENGVDVTTRTWVEFDGFALDFYVSMRMTNRQHMTFHGSDGVIELPAPFNAQLVDDPCVILRTGDTKTIQRFGRAQQYVAQVDAFNDSALNGTPHPYPLEFSRANATMLDMIRAGAQ